MMSLPGRRAILALTSDDGVRQKQKESFAKAQADLTDTLNKLEKTLTFGQR